MSSSNINEPVSGTRPVLIAGHESKTKHTQAQAQAESKRDLKTNTGRRAHKAHTGHKDTTLRYADTQILRYKWHHTRILTK